LKIKVCHISTVHPAFDVRIFHKECVSLAKADYDVSLVVTHNKKEIVQGVSIIPLPKSKGRLHRIFIKSLLAFYKALKTRSKIIHFHDPELIGLGILFKILGKKVIYDSHENVSSQIENKAWLGNKLIRLIVKKTYRIFEKKGVLFFDSVISVTPEIVKFLSQKKGTLVRNYPIISLINSSQKEIKHNVPILIYVGGLTKIRGIKEICDAVRIIKKDIELHLVGAWESESYQKECMYNNHRVKYFGVKPLKEVYSLIHKADVGFVTLYPEKNYLNSFPIKAFEYMACEIPMIMSNFPYWEKTFEGCAKFVNPLSIKEITDAINYLIENKSEAKTLGKKGKIMIESQFSWKSESEKLIALYKSLEK
jgi:glycosyltransferase involved in cell wall biosynthesis